MIYYDIIDDIDDLFMILNDFQMLLTYNFLDV